MIVIIMIDSSEKRSCEGDYVCEKRSKQKRRKVLAAHASAATQCIVDSSRTADCPHSSDSPSCPLLSGQHTVTLLACLWDWVVWCTELS